MTKIKGNHSMIAVDTAGAEEQIMPVSVQKSNTQHDLDSKVDSA